MAAVSTKHLWKRGGIYWFRMRTPKQFREIVQGAYIARSLKTDSLTQAATLVSAVKAQLIANLEAELAGDAPAASRETYAMGLAIAKSHRMKMLGAEQVANLPLPELLKRTGYTRERDPEAATPLFAALLGGVEVPSTTLLEVAQDMERLLEPEIRAKNARQRRVWASKWRRAAQAFSEVIGDKPIRELTEHDAFMVRRAWRERAKSGEIETDYANKHLGYLERMVSAFYDDLEIDDFRNPFKAIRIERKQPWEMKQKKAGKRQFAPIWIRDTILAPGALRGMNEEARDIIIICAETGCREAEVFDLPASSIHLDDPIPHFRIKVEMPGAGGNADEPRRDIKTLSSIRPVPLVGFALEAMRRHPGGFPRYRGNANFYNSVNKYFREKRLFPSEDHTIGGLRHSFESRMKALKISNEEAAQLMGHSLKKIRGRPVYGDETELQIRALYTEMIAFPTPSWTPRPHLTLIAEVERILDEEGFKLPR